MSELVPALKLAHYMPNEANENVPVMLQSSTLPSPTDSAQIQVEY